MRITATLDNSSQVLILNFTEINTLDSSVVLYNYFIITIINIQLGSKRICFFLKTATRHSQSMPKEIPGWLQSVQLFDARYATCRPGTPVLFPAKKTQRTSSLAPRYVNSKFTYTILNREGLTYTDILQIQLVRFIQKYNFPAPFPQPTRFVSRPYPLPS